MDQLQTNDWHGALMAAMFAPYTGSVVVKSETLLAIKEEIERLHAENARLLEISEAADEAAATRERMESILTRTANALRGTPPPLTLWSWHDLPDRAAAAIAAIDVMQRAAAILATQADSEPPNAKFSGRR